ncbi:PKD domain-containing protein [Lacinutrix sp.]|uniref:PKD domain-containing protein n=1 Tax=Lacinutrix sp. TaxID=1937692 RepID=UPI0025C1D975|nr:PKD domain-containing protein [Lacinutrix sp.]
MKTINFKRQILSKTNLVLILVFTLMTISCDYIDDLPEANSIADETPPTALFTFTNGELVEDFTQVSFANQSSDAINYSWDFGDGTTSNELDPSHVYSGEGTFIVTLVSSDALSQTSTFTDTVELIQPEEPAVLDPVLLNADFNKLPKLGASDCACSGWDNDDIGEQGESSSGNGGSDNVVKFDNNEPDHVYQEFAVTPNADYAIQIVTSFKGIATPPGSFPGSMLELRVLSGAGYTSGYTPIYYDTSAEVPNSGFGYSSVAQVEDAANNLLVDVISNPGNDDYNTSQVFIFNSGANDSVALFIRGIGGDGSVGNYGYSSGDEEIRADSVVITAIN